VVGWYQQGHVDESDFVIIDDQSNRSLASPAFFDMFNILDKPENYTLSTCSGIIATSGRRGRGFVVESGHVDESDFVQLVELEFHLYYLECGHILSTLVDSSECQDSAS
jgi:hypothetical protein